MAGLLSRLGRKKSVHIWSAVVVAAGSARRMEGIDKVLTTLGELPVLVHTLRVFQQCPDIAIHDGARPLLPPDVLEEVLHRAAQTGAAAPAVPITDTVKRSENGLAVETVDRSTLFAVQTPQVFQADLIRAAVQKALEDGEVLTDDCAAVERLGMKVSLTRGSRENLKLTTPFDLIVGEAILDARERGELGCPCALDTDTTYTGW